MRRLAVILTAAATVTAGLVAVPAQAATLPSPPTTGYAIFTAPLPNAGWGTRFQATASASGISIGEGGFTVGGFDATGDFARTFISPPTGQAFAVGTYDINESATATQARVQIDSAAPAQCASTSGTPHRARGDPRRRRGHGVRGLGARHLRHRPAGLRPGDPLELHGADDRAHRTGQYLRRPRSSRAGRRVGRHLR